MWTIGNLGFVLSCLLFILLRDHPTPALLYLMVVAQGALGYGLTSVWAQSGRRSSRARIMLGSLAPRWWPRSPAAPSAQLADCLDHREPGAHRPLGIVLMRLRIAEMTVSGSDIHFDLSRSSPCAAAR
jgi:hypothetical protein